MNNFVTSLIRTWVPIVVGSVLSHLATAGLDIDPHDAQGLITAVTGIFIAVYYLIARWLETNWPQLGWLLGTAKKVQYKEVK